MSSRFSFGTNWKRYVKYIVNNDILEEAVTSLDRYGVDLTDKTIIDVGCGSGLFTMAFCVKMAKEIIAFDYDQESVAATKILLERFSHLIGNTKVKVFRGSILDDDLIRSLRNKGDVVYSWGVLHHTGSLWKAIENVGKIVAPGGNVIIAIYNHAPSSPIWHRVKSLYNRVPLFAKALMVIFYGALITIDHYIHNRRLSLRRERGMHIWTDVVDWLGGLPYEYACFEEVKTFMEEQGFYLERSPKRIECGKGLTPTIKSTLLGVNTGCNEFVFKKIVRI